MLDIELRLIMNIAWPEIWPKTIPFLVSYDIIKCLIPRLKFDIFAVKVNFRKLKSTKNTLSMNKRFLPFESEFNGFLEQVEIEQKLGNVQIQKVSRLWPNMIHTPWLHTRIL